MQNKSAFIYIVVINLILATNVYATPRDNGFYVNINTPCCRGTTTYYETSSAGYDSNGTRINETVKSHENSVAEPIEVKIGYKHLNNNRIEVFRRNTDIILEDGKNGTIVSKTVGLNYELGINSLASSNKKVMPFVSVGVGWGDASSKSEHVHLKTSDSLELDAGVGVHYQLGKHVDTTLGLFRRKITLTGNNTERLFTDGNITTTMINVGISYHFWP